MLENTNWSGRNKGRFESWQVFKLKMKSREAFGFTGFVLVFSPRSRGELEGGAIFQPGIRGAGSHPIFLWSVILWRERFR